MRSTRKIITLTLALATGLVLHIWHIGDLVAQPVKDCGNSCFTSRLMEVSMSDECSVYEFEVMFQGDCRYELSHFNIQASCGIFTEAHNSGGWKMEMNSTDPTTGLKGLKVDNINGFGKDPSRNSFRVRFTLCPDKDCPAPNECGPFRMAYKAANCIYYEDLQIPCTSTPVVSYTVESPRCPGGSDGTIRLSIIEGLAPYAVSWNTGQSGESLEGLAAGLYTYTVTDSNGGIVTGDVQISEPPVLAVGYDLRHPGCEGTSTGYIQVEVNGGTSPYTYLWSNGSESEMLHNLGSGIYEVLITDAAGCTEEAQFYLKATQSISVNAEIVKPSCDGSRLGSISLVASGGTEPYSFTWSNGATGADIDALSEGYYTVTITDSNGCNLKRTFSVKTDNTLSASARITNTNCFNDPIGAIELQISGGTAPYSVEWSTGEQQENLTGLVAGKYTAHISDAAGCTLQYSAYVRETQLFVYPVIVQHPSCPGDSDGSIDMEVYYGTEPYRFEWSNGFETKNLTDLTAGTYSVMVTDAEGCTASRTVTLVEPEPLTLNITAEAVSCDTDPVFDLHVSADGGNGDYQFTWHGGQTGSKLSDAGVGSYTVTVYDSKGCSVESSFEVDTEQYPCPITEEDDKVDADDETGKEDENSDDSAYDNPDSGSGTGESQEGEGKDSGDDGEVGGDDGNEGDSGVVPESEPSIPPAGKDNCTECFYSSPVSAVKIGDIYQIEIEIYHRSDCRYDLSHLTIALPACATVAGYSNSRGWPMEVVKKDPTTGLTGVKVDDIPSFGKSPGESFTVLLTLRVDDSSCSDLLNCFAPVLAYKAATCVQYEQSISICSNTVQGLDMMYYPNPAENDLTISLSYELQFSGQLELINNMGRKVYTQEWNPGVDSLTTIDLSSLSPGIYILRLIAKDGRSASGRLLINK